MGPFRMMDLVGLDLGWRARKLGGKDSPLHAKIAMNYVSKIDMGKKMELVTITTLKDLGHQIQLLKMRPPMKKYQLRMVSPEEIFLMKKSSIDVFLP